jgi:hypothetical protein
MWLHLEQGVTVARIDSPACRECWIAAAGITPASQALGAAPDASLAILMNQAL